MNFLEIFELNYFKNCNVITSKRKKYNGPSDMFHRGHGWRTLFELLINQNKKNYQFIETGVVRELDNWIDGQSTFLFQEFLKLHNGKVYCVDISEEACNVARSFLDPRYVAIECNDSCKFLKKIDKSNIDFFHLDSYDVKWANDEASANHHLQEFLIIEPYLKSESIVMIDDNTVINGKRVGKGRKIYEYLTSKGKQPLYDRYQLIYQF